MNGRLVEMAGDFLNLWTDPLRVRADSILYGDELDHADHPFLAPVYRRGTKKATGTGKPPPRDIPPGAAPIEGYTRALALFQYWNWASIRSFCTAVTLPILAFAALTAASMTLTREEV